MSDHLMHATIHDVAKKAGVSTVTATRILSGSDSPVSEAVRKRVLTAARALNYKPDLTSQLLEKSCSKDIAVLLPTLTNPFFTDFLQGAETAANHSGIRLIVCNTMRNQMRERDYLEALANLQISTIILSAITTDLAVLKTLIERHRLCVAAPDQSIPELAHCFIDFNIRRAAHDAVRYLAFCGHSRIALISSPTRTYFRKELLRGYRDGLLDCGLAPDSTLELISTVECEPENGEIYEFENGRLMADKLTALHERPTAVLCADDMTAAGVLQRLSEQQLNTPAEISVMGMGNSSIAKMLSPALTTVDLSPFDAGMRLTRALIEAEKNDGVPVKTVTVEPRIVERASVQNLK